jgi:hypothetical protein
MKRIAMLLCLVIALGWISDTGLLTLKIGDSQIVGIPTQVGYSYTVAYDKWVTKFTPTAIALQMKLGWKPMVLVNGKMTYPTRLGNGWLFNFTEKETINAGGLSNR